MKKNPINYIWKDRKRFLGMPLSFTRYRLSEDRIFLEVGLLNMKQEEVLLYRIRDISLSRSLGQRLVGVGTVKLHSSDKTTPELILKNIKNAPEVKELIHTQVEEMKLKRRMRVGELLGHDPGDDDLDPEEPVQ